MIALSFMLHARRWRNRGARPVSVLPPLWPLVLVAVTLWAANCCLGADTAAGGNWEGHSRNEVLTALGKPLSTLQRGDTEVLMYPQSVRVEIRDNVVVSFRSGNQAVLVKSDGTRYAASDRGKVTRVVTPPPAEDVNEAPRSAPPVATAPLPSGPKTAGPISSSPPPANAAPGAAPAPPASTAAPAGAGPAAAPAAAVTNSADAHAPDAKPGDATLVKMIKDGESDEAKSWTHVPGVATGDGNDLESKMLKMADDYAQHGQLSGDDASSQPAWAKPVREAVLAIIRFGFALLVLRVAINWVGLPCYLPDLAKVAALFVVIREGVYGLGALGGQWQWLHLLRAADIVSFLALCGLLVRFKVALEGITALKIAVATEVATYFVMGAIGLALAFGLSALH